MSVRSVYKAKIDKFDRAQQIANSIGRLVEADNVRGRFVVLNRRELFDADVFAVLWHVIIEEDPENEPERGNRGVNPIYGRPTER